MLLVSVVGPRVHPAVEDIQALVAMKLKTIRLLPRLLNRLQAKQNQGVG
jgi:hypothetical protein